MRTSVRAGRLVAAASTAVLGLAGLLATAPVASGSPSAVTGAAVEGYEPVVRIGGANRYEVAVNALDSTGLQSSLAVVASGEVFSDALPSGAVAARRGAPLLLTRKDDLTAPTRNELGQFFYERFLVVGGPGTIGDPVIDELDRRGHLELISRETRYANAAGLATTTFTAPVPVAYVTSGADYPDALSAVPAAATGGGPVLLTQRTTLPAATRSALTALAPRRIVVVGGPGSVDPSVLAALGPYASEGVSRIGGADRYEVSAALSRATFPSGARVAYLASGRTYADALAAGPQAGVQQGPVLLTARDRVPDAVLTELIRLKPRRIVVLGGPATVSDAVLSQVSGLTVRATATDVSGRGTTACALAAGHVECWGSNMRGELGTGSGETSVAVPVPVRGITRDVLEVRVGWDKVCAVDVQGTVWCWGSRTTQGTDDQLSAATVDLPAASSVSVGVNDACAVTTTGEVWCWGDSSRIVAPPLGPASQTPQRITGLPSGVTAVTVGTDHACARTLDGEVWCWGSNTAGQAGRQPVGGSTAPVRVDLGGPAADVAAGQLHTCAVLSAGGVRCWGANWAGQLGQSGPATSGLPLVPTGLETARGTVSAGRSESCLLTDGKPTCWGGDRPTPRPFTGLGAGLVRFSHDEQTTCGLRSDGAAVCAPYSVTSGKVSNLPASATGLRVTGY